MLRCEPCDNDMDFSKRGKKWYCAFCGKRIITGSQRAENPITLEDEFFAQWRNLKTSDLPDPETQFEITVFDPALGKKRTFPVDFVWPVNKLVLEIDGGTKDRKTGGGKHNSSADRWRCNLIESYGWNILHVDTEMLHSRPAQVVELVSTILTKQAQWRKLNGD